MSNNFRFCSTPAYHCRAIRQRYSTVTWHARSSSLRTCCPSVEDTEPFALGVVNLVKLAPTPLL